MRKVRNTIRLGKRGERWRQLTAVVAVALCLLLASGCRRDKAASDGRPLLAATTPAIAWMVQEIGGDDVNVVSLLPSGSDAESYEPDMATMKSLSGSSTLYTLSTPGFEQSTVRRVADATGKTLSVTDLSVGIERIDDSHSGGYDPHYLSSPANARKVAAAILADMERRYPDKAETMRARADALDKRLAAASDSVKTLLGNPGEGCAIVAIHPSLGYYARDYGLRQISLEENGKEVTPRGLERGLAEAHKAGAGVLVYERTHSPDRATLYAAELGIPTIGVDFNAADFARQYTQIARAITGPTRQ